MEHFAEVEQARVQRDNQHAERLTIQRLLDQLVKQTTVSDGSSHSGVRQWFQDVELTVLRMVLGAHTIEIVSRTVSVPLRK